MIQNILTIHSANNIFESQWSSRYIDNVQIISAGDLDVESHDGYYDHSGTLKDMIQNYVLQVVALFSMEPPVIFSEKETRTGKVKALRAIHLYSEEGTLQNLVRGQYGEGQLAGQTSATYHDEPGVVETLSTETFVAGKSLTDNLRWSGVPFYIHVGKRLAEKGTRIDIVSRQVSINAFKDDTRGECDKTDLPPDVLAIYIQPTEGSSLTLNGKGIDQRFNTIPMKLDFR